LKPKDVCNSTGSTLNTIVSALSPDFRVVDRSDGGTNWTISMLARESHTDVRCLCNARQTNPRIGPADGRYGLEEIVQSLRVNWEIK
jgi:hypothetical protein